MYDNQQVNITNMSYSGPFLKKMHDGCARGLDPKPRALHWEKLPRHIVSLRTDFSVCISRLTAAGVSCVTPMHRLPLEWSSLMFLSSLRSGVNYLICEAHRTKNSRNNHESPSISKPKQVTEVGHTRGHRSALDIGWQNSKISNTPVFLQNHT